MKLMSIQENFSLHYNNLYDKRGYRMNVLYITHYSALFGANRALLEIIDMGKKNGVNPVVATLTDGEICDELKKRNIPCLVVGGYPWTTKQEVNHLIRMMKRGRNIFVNTAVVMRIVRICRNYSIDLIHTNSSVVDVGAKTAKLLKLPHIWHIREFGDIDYNLEFYFNRSRAIKFMEDYSHKIICISNTLKEYYKPYIKKNNKWEVVYDGVDFRNYVVDRKHDYKENECLTILFMGLIQENKNQLELIKSVDLLCNKYNCKNVHVFFCGSGNEDYIRLCKDYARNKGIMNNIEFVGNVKDVRPYLQRSDIGVTASKMEAFGRVTIEYMYAGLCVVASNCGANVEILEEGSAVLYNFGDPNSLCKCLKELYYDVEKRKRIAETGNRNALKKYTAEINMRNLLEIYENALT